MERRRQEPARSYVKTSSDLTGLYLRLPREAWRPFLFDASVAGSAKGEGGDFYACGAGK